MMKKVTLVWFRRDLRLEDNVALYHAFKDQKYEVVPLFIFDKNILDDLDDAADRRVVFIYQTISKIKRELRNRGGDLQVRYGEPVSIWKELLTSYHIAQVYYNRDYEPYAIERDRMVLEMLQNQGVEVYSFKDQVIFEADEIKKSNNDPYVVFTPYKKRWLKLKQESEQTNGLLQTYDPKLDFAGLAKVDCGAMPTLESMGFHQCDYDFPARTVNKDLIASYDLNRDYPSSDGTSRLGVHLRFGTIGIRAIVNEISQLNEVFLNELIWREFYSQILSHFPRVVQESFRPKYDHIPWRNDPEEFDRWCQGNTGFPFVDAGMRQLNKTGYMHNRARMVAASFLTKHLLIDWRWGEAYFAKKLLDYDLASNNGGWQWAAGCGTDAAPYFRIFNPTAQQRKFDPKEIYVRKWIPELGTPLYPKPIVDHSQARQRCLQTYKRVLS